MWKTAKNPSCVNNLCWRLNQKEREHLANWEEAPNVSYFLCQWGHYWVVLGKTRSEFYDSAQSMARLVTHLCTVLQSFQWIYQGLWEVPSKAMFGFFTADFWSSFAYESAEEKPKHCLTWDFLSALRMIRWGRLRAFWSFFTWAILSYTQYVVSWLLAHLWSVIFIQRLLPSQKYDFLS